MQMGTSAKKCSFAIVDGRPGIRPMMILTLSSDHRAVDGARAAEFLRDLVTALSDPERLLSA